MSFADDFGAPNNLGDRRKEDERNLEEKTKELRRAAEAGDPDAMFNLGKRCHAGEGVEQDFVEAVKWYRRAAEVGELKATTNLG